MASKSFCKGGSHGAQKIDCSLITLAIIAATMIPLALTSYAQTPVAEPNSDISGTIDVAMVANPQMVALQELVESGAFNELYPNITVNLTVLPENEIRQTITQDVTTQSGQFDVFTIGPFEVPLWAEQGWLEEVGAAAEANPDYDLDRRLSKA